MEISIMIYTTKETKKLRTKLHNSFWVLRFTKRWHVVYLQLMRDDISIHGIFPCISCIFSGKVLIIKNRPCLE